MPKKSLSLSQHLLICRCIIVLRYTQEEKQVGHVHKKKNRTLYEPVFCPNHLLYREFEILLNLIADAEDMNAFYLRQRYFYFFFECLLFCLWGFINNNIFTSIAFYLFVQTDKF